MVYNFYAGETLVDQLLFSDPLDEHGALEFHRKWHPRWPDEIRPTSAVAQPDLKNFQDFK